MKAAGLSMGPRMDGYYQAKLPEKDRPVTIEFLYHTMALVLQRGLQRPGPNG